MSTQRMLGSDEPVMRAWKAYRESEEYANGARWAVKPEHTEGSLWGAFVAGFTAQPSTPAASEARGAETECADCDGCGWTEGGSTLRTLCESCGGWGVVSSPTPAPAPGEAESEEMAALRKENEALRARLLIAEQLLAEERVTADALVSEADADAARERDVRRRTSKEYSGNLCAAFDKINALESQLAAATRELESERVQLRGANAALKLEQEGRQAAERALAEAREALNPARLTTLANQLERLADNPALSRVVADGARRDAEYVRALAALPPTPTPPEGTPDA